MEGDGIRAAGEFLVFIWTFVFGKYYGWGALNRFLVVLILIETRAVLIMKVSPGVIFPCAGFSTSAYFGFLFSRYSRARCQIPRGEFSMTLLLLFFLRAHRDFVMNIR